jgi:hypothetical protein
MKAPTVTSPPDTLSCRHQEIEGLEEIVPLGRVP